VCQKQEEVKGVDEAFSIEQDSMHIRWGRADEITATLSPERQIIVRMRRQQG